MDEFSAEDVHALVDAALTDALPAPRSEGGVERPLPLTLMNMGLFATTAELVHKYLAEPDAVIFLDELRHRMVEGLDRGTPKQLYTQVTHCVRCSDVERPPCLPINGQHSPDLLVVHELPFRGQGVENKLVEALTTVGFDPKRVMHTSIVRCDPNTVRAANEEEIANCTPYLFAEIQLCMPKLVLLLGAKPLQVFLGEDLKITQERGKVFWLGQWAMLPSLSLGYIARRAEKEYEVFLQDLKTAFTYCYGPSDRS